MNLIEKELREASGYKVDRKFSNRQDYLKSVLNAANKMSDDDFDSLSDESANWINAAITAINSRDLIPDFDEEIDKNKSEEVDDDADEASEDVDPETGEILEADAAEEDDDADDTDASNASEQFGDDEQQSTKKDRKPKKEVVRQFNKYGKRIFPKQPRPPKTVEVIHKTPPPDGKENRRGKLTPGHQDVELDKWGCMVGSKNSRALELFEAGATSKEVDAELNGTYYNILKKMVLNGHKLERTGHVLKLTHADDLKAATKQTAKPKKK